MKIQLQTKEQADKVEQDKIEGIKATEGYSEHEIADIRMIDTNTIRIVIS